MKSPTQTNGEYENHKEKLFIQGRLQSSRFYLYIGSERSAFQCAPFCRHADKMQDKGFQPACLFQWLDLIADMTDEIEIEVLRHGGNHHENHILSHKGKWKMSPAEVIVLYVEVLFTCPTLIIECNDVLLGRCPVIDKDTAVCVYYFEHIRPLPAVLVFQSPTLRKRP